MFERMARMPRNQLLDQLFELFKKQPRWSIRPLRERVQQPEVYLKEVLSDIAFLHKSGEYNGLWELQDFVKDSSVSRSSPSTLFVTSHNCPKDEARRHTNGKQFCGRQDGGRR